MISKSIGKFLAKECESETFEYRGTDENESFEVFHVPKNVILGPAAKNTPDQFCANNPDTFLMASRLVENVCDGVDLNLGCPQMVAKRGRYGAYLQDEMDLVCSMISAVRDFCALPVSCKIRILSSRKQTVEYARRLVDAGATMLTVHGRTREMKGADTGLADWSCIKDVVDAVDIPVVANGNIQMPGDIERCLNATNAAAIMSAEGILYNPFLFMNKNEESWRVAKEYLKFARKYQATTSAIRAHIFRICHHSLLEYADLRTRVSIEHCLEDYESIVEEIRIRTRAIADTEESRQKIQFTKELFERIRRGDEKLDPIALSKTPHWICKPYFRLPNVVCEGLVAEGEKSYKEKRKEHLQQVADELGLSLKQARKRERRKLNGQRTTISKRVGHSLVDGRVISIRRNSLLAIDVVNLLDRVVRICFAKNVVAGHADWKGGIAKDLEVTSMMQRTINPTCTGTSVIALQYGKGVVIMTDRVVSYGKTARYKNVSRQYKVNNNMIVAFGGDHADFQWLQNVIERKLLEWKMIGQDLSPKALHGYLTSLMYARRTRMNPLWNTLVVAGVEDEEKNNKETSIPFIGVITQKGVAYQTKYVATGIAAMLLNQLIEDEGRKKGDKLTRTEAETVMRKALELTIYHDCCADNDFELGVVDADDGVIQGKQETIIGDWSIAETNCQYE
ncbi:peptidase, T1 family [Dictyocaulus viviparus]|uniref:tRNA-dihydrouridine(16/17) synthase [NAD(P)(+)] n=1 Tax=Dictyocaulus viviparus TaxID=29172 RepID=A0A0D8XR01_DICVI|nr:peptidase, T1 family [Dictyocaulus viviparus]